jgi:hypothetical protein
VDAQGRMVGVNMMMAGPEVGMAAPVPVTKEFLCCKLGREKEESQAAWLG